jgi:hypothetical protein
LVKLSHYGVAETRPLTDTDHDDSYLIDMRSNEFDLGGEESCMRVSPSQEDTCLFPYIQKVGQEAVAGPKVLSEGR